MLILAQMHTDILNHSLDAAHSLASLRQVHSLDSLSSGWGKSRGYGPAHLVIRIFGRVCGSRIVMENRSRDLTVLWSDEENLVSRPKS